MANGPPESVNFTDGTASLKVHPCRDSDPANAMFCTSHNYVYNTAIVNGPVPYGVKGFIAIRKSGEAAVFKLDQATTAGWGNNCTRFQNNVGLKAGDNAELAATATPPTL